ncbi:MAG: hypothetical protein M0C28_36960 [Candidatus Moduliflexus flocculans]|nr:hypothetical protein [Candidatus Moduliflexus flocculans]
MASGDGPDEADAAFAVPPALLRAGANALALEGHRRGRPKAARALARARPLLVAPARLAQASQRPTSPRTPSAIAAPVPRSPTPRSRGRSARCSRRAG